MKMSNPLVMDVLELFDKHRITTNSLRKFVAESVADFLHDDKHTKIVGKLFDKWYKHQRRMIWVGAARYALVQIGVEKDTATDEAKRLYSELYTEYDAHYEAWRDSNED